MQLYIKEILLVLGIHKRMAVPGLKEVIINSGKKLNEIKDS